ncbi:MAG: cupin domain-containing protein [Kribbellaceae bacterium]
MPEGLDAKIVGPDDGRTVRLFGVRFDYKVESADSGGTLAVLEVTIPPHTLVKPHSHTHEDEFSLVLDGTVGIRTGDNVAEATEGSYLVKPRGIPHAMWNASDKPARVIEMLSPGGLEEYFEKLGPILAHEGGAGAKEYYELAETYGITIEDDWIEELEKMYGVKL